MKKLMLMVAGAVCAALWTGTAAAGMLGAVKATGFSAIAVTNGVATLSVVVGKADSLDKPDWKPVSTNDIPVEADSPVGFFIVAPQVPSDLDLPPIVTVK